MLDKSLPPRTLKLNAADNVVVAVDPIDIGVTAAGVEALKRIPRGHKMDEQKYECAPVGLLCKIVRAGSLTGNSRRAMRWVQESNQAWARVKKVLPRLPPASKYRYVTYVDQWWWWWLCDYADTCMVTEPARFSLAFPRASILFSLLNTSLI